MSLVIENGPTAIGVITLVSILFILAYYQKSRQHISHFTCFVNLLHSSPNRLRQVFFFKSRVIQRALNFIVVRIVDALDDNVCPASGHVRHYGRPSGYLVWKVAANDEPQLGVSKIGSDHCPWTILVEQGQRISLTVVVVLPTDGASCATEIIAEQPGLIAGSNVVLRANACTLVNGNQAKRHLLVSTGHMLQVYINSGRHGQTTNNALTILLQYAGAGSMWHTRLYTLTYLLTNLSSRQ